MTGAQPGDRIRIRGAVVGSANREGEVLAVRGESDQLLVVRYDDGHEAILAPGADCEVLHRGR